MKNLRKFIREEVERYLDEAPSQASIEAQRRGLHHVAYGNYADDTGRVVAKSQNGRLVALQNKQDLTSNKSPEFNSFPNFRNLINQFAYRVKDPSLSTKEQEESYKVLQFLQNNRDDILYNGSHPEVLQKLTQFVEKHPYKGDTSTQQQAEPEPEEQVPSEPSETDFEQMKKGEMEPDNVKEEDVSQQSSQKLPNESDNVYRSRMQKEKTQRMWDKRNKRWNDWKKSQKTGNVELKKETKGDTGWGEWKVGEADPHADGI